MIYTFKMNMPNANADIEVNDRKKIKIKNSHIFLRILFLTNSTIITQKSNESNAAITRGSAMKASAM